MFKLVLETVKDNKETLIKEAAVIILLASARGIRKLISSKPKVDDSPEDDKN